MKRPAKVDHNAINRPEVRKRHAEHLEKMAAHIRELNQNFGKTGMDIAPAPQALIGLEHFGDEIPDFLVAHNRGIEALREAGESHPASSGLIRPIGR